MGEIVHDSIIENKEKTKSYWEQLMLAANSSPSSSLELKQSNGQSSPPSQINHQMANHKRLAETGSPGGPKIVETVTKKTLSDKDETNLKFNDNVGKRGSVIEREIQMQMEREAAFAQEREEALHKANKTPNSESRTLIDQDEILNYSIPTTDDGNFSEYGSEDKEEHSLDESSNEKETPIEREIRLSREREEELRREKQITPTNFPTILKGRSKSLTSELSSPTTPTTPTTPADKPTVNENMSEQNVTTFSRGVIKKVIIKDRNRNHSIPTESESLKNSTVNFIEKTPTTATGQMNFSSANSSSTKGAVPKLFSRNPNQKGLMKRFIASRGKLTSTFTFASPPSPNAANSKMNTTPPSAQLLPKVQNWNTAVVNREKEPSLVGTRPGYVSAEDKIQVELQEMRKREQELKEQRARSFVRSQPDLLSLLNEEEEQEQTFQAQPINLRSAVSIPNLIDVDDNTKISNETKPQIKRSALIDVWESMIQKN